MTAPPIFGKRRTTAQVGDAERRDAPRHQTSIAARITMPGGKSVRCCIINMSSSGALLLVSSLLGVPEHFDLQDNAGEVRRAQVVRREPSRVAVRFM
jgi:PilZ domain-containing protein